MSAGYPIVRLERTIPAPPGRVYRAWLDPEMVSRWMAPVGLHVSRAEVDERVGGYLRVWQTGPEGEDVGGFECDLLELVPDRRIVFRWRFVGPERAFDAVNDSRLTITLREAAGNATALTLVHERLDGLAAAMPDVAKNIEPGWRGTLGRLAAAVGDTHERSAPLDRSKETT
jgi:uncharacterized protein YndB with AHSA1/START domain